MTFTARGLQREDRTPPSLGPATLETLRVQAMRLLRSGQQPASLRRSLFSVFLHTGMVSRSIGPPPLEPMESSMSTLLRTHLTASRAAAGIQTPLWMIVATLSLLEVLTPSGA
jgi:hypothetical protein